ncbi:MAG: hypothetical protein OZSIB_1997 [Candidatus Ozemobacter sibiricus]|jgi:hypothetical protein|uniref:SH3b domain-containing protein n=1 Tax=Candidatus Ozemobacter sibiricus TaxID=2268124 RepID=A0A367ZJP9_9BACT|nr:MAG: hypothetical protein OZSIB_1997 [Candidatus Ozemobacter sibiricus]
MSPVIRSVLVCLVAVVALSWAVPLPAGAEESLLCIVGSNVRVRAEPSLKGKEIGVVRFGQIVPTLDQTAKPETVAGMTDVWRKVRLPDGKEGWVFGGLTMSYDPARPVDCLIAACDRRLEMTDTIPADAIVVLDWANDRLKNATTDDERLFFGVYQPLILSWFASRLMDKDHDPEKAIKHPAVKPYADLLVYSEPAGQWLPRTERLWELHDRYAASALSDRLARKIADIPLPGESEGYPPAVLSRAMLSLGEYLKRHPDGLFVEEVLTVLKDWINFDPQPGFDPMADLHPDDFPSFRQQIAECKALLQKIDHPRKGAVLERLDAALQRLDRR